MKTFSSMVSSRKRLERESWKFLCLLASMVLLSSVAVLRAQTVTYTTINPTGSNGSTVVALSDGNAVGYYTSSTNGTTHGFVYAVATQTPTTIDPPGSTDTQPAAIAGNRIVGTYQDGAHVYHGFLFDGSHYSTIDPPGSTFTSVTGVSAAELVG